MAKLMEALAKAGARLLLAAIAPQQAGEAFARHWPIGVSREPGEDRPRLASARTKITTGAVG
jgi:hypothetical protein